MADIQLPDLRPSSYDCILPSLKVQLQRDVSLPELPKLPQNAVEQVSYIPPEMKIPSAMAAPKIVLPQVTMSSVCIDIPPVQKTVVPTPEAAMQLDKVDVPKVNKPLQPIEIEIVPTICASVEIPNVEQCPVPQPVQPLCLGRIPNIPVPEMPNFLRVRQDILESMHH